MCFRFTQIVGRRRRQIETKIEHLVFRDVQAKLAALLLELGDEYGQEVEDGILIGVKITHQEMANLIGSTRETISLTLAQFKKKGLSRHARSQRRSRRLRRNESDDVAAERLHRASTLAAGHP